MKMNGFRWFYMSVVGKLVGLESPYFMSARWADIVCQMDNVFLTIPQVSPGFFTWGSQGSKENEFILKPLLLSCFLMTLDYSKSYGQAQI